MSRNIVFEGWLTKSPPTKRIWRTKWRRRWFALRQGELPGQYFLDYYADRNCRRLKGTINLDLCEQVDAGLHMERSGTLDPKLRGSVFTIQTQSRTYHLEADCEADMEKWVDAICRVCGLRATEDSPNFIATYQHNINSMTAINDQYECTNNTGPYIPISECITGARTQDTQRAFTFDPKIIVTSSRTPFERMTDNRIHQMYMSQPHIRLNYTDLSENESNLSDEECKSLNTSQSNIKDWSAAKSFTKLAIASKRNGLSEDEPPEPPPRPPKTFQANTTFQGPKIQEPIEQHDNISIHGQTTPWLLTPRRSSQGANPPSPSRLHLSPYVPTRTTDDEDDYSPGLPSMQYYNLSSLPPAVDRALKPRHSSHSFGHINNISRQAFLQGNQYDEVKADVLQYLDLDLHIAKPVPSKPREAPRKNLEIVHGKSLLHVDTDSAYRSVDFLKTEAFNSTRQDAEASRSNHH